MKVVRFKKEASVYFLFNNTSLGAELGNFESTILHPLEFKGTGSRWDPDVQQFRKDVGPALLALIAQEKNKASAVPKKEKKIQGGC